MDEVQNRDELPRPVLDFHEIEQCLRAELAAAMERLNHARENLSNDSNGSGPPEAESREYTDALAALERASIRFSEFILNSTIPTDLRAPNRRDRSASSRTR